MNSLKLKLVASLLLIMSITPVRADVAVVVGAESPLSSVSADIAKDVFLKKVDNIEGHKVIPIDLPKENPAYESFYQKIANKTSDQLLAYWSRLIFTGKSAPPQVASSPEELVFLLSRNPDLIGYIPEEQVSAELKVVLKVQ